MQWMSCGDRTINTLLPDVVTIDISLQPGSGISVLENIKRQHPKIQGHRADQLHRQILRRQLQARRG